MDKYLEYIAVLFGIAYVVLAARGNVWCWLMGIINCALYIYIFLRVQLYYDSALQVFYVAAGFYGWWKWQKGKESDFKVQSVSIKNQLPLVAAGTIATIILGFITYLKLQTPLTFFDAGIFAFSLIATWMTAKKYFQSWLWWIGIDIVGIWLYWMKDLQASSFQYFIFTIAAVYGYYEWKKQLSPSSSQ